MTASRLRLVKVLGHTAPMLPPRELTPEQKERRATIEKRAKLIQAGIAPPASGIYGRPPKAKAA